MQQIINFLLRNKNFLLFLFLMLLAIGFTIQSHSYHRSKIISSTNFLSGSLYEWQASLGDYLDLKTKNQRLLVENERLRNLLTKAAIDTTNSSYTDSTSYNIPFSYYRANVIRNDYQKNDNYILIDKGHEDSIKIDMGVITDKGIVGIVEGTSANYARVISILNSNSRINAGLKNSDQYGSLLWNGKDPNVVQLTTIPRQAIIRKGDTIITHGRSTIFPKGIGIGIISDYSMNQNNSYYLIDVTLFNDMTNIGYVYAIKNHNAEEIKTLQTSDE
ncbi:rod shape-determining protein MreC [Aquimarina sp. W85]|uniref:rod shape-determining protein MreC n=1 Tax=Aquimarina rhodophyticola TaxID=3342246 RepID=UPI0036706944